MSEPVIEKLKNKRSGRAGLMLDSLLEITQAINNNFSAADLFKLFEYVLHQQLGIQKFAYCTNDRPWKWTVVHAPASEVELIRPETELEQYTQLTLIDSNSPRSLQGFQIIIPVFHKKEALAYLLLGNLEEDILEDIQEHDLEFIQTISNIIAVAIENKRLFRENVQQELLRKELDLAREMQSMLFPATLPNDDTLELSAFYQPHRQVGGDYYDFIRLSPEEVMFCVADVSGKGVSAALLMSNFQANLRALAGRMYDLSALVAALNEKVMQSAKGEKFITFFVARYNTATRGLQYVNAGHNPPLLRTSRGVEVLRRGCPGLGILDELKNIETGRLIIEENSFLVCYTDGLVEQENDKGKDFGLEKLIEILEKNTGMSAAAFNEMLVAQLSEYKQTQPFIDDIALLTCRFF